MTLSWPSAFAAVTSASMPPQEAAAVQVAQLAVLAAEALAEELPAAALVVELAALDELEELELLQPAASKIDPTAATDATIALDARKGNPPIPARKGSSGAGVCILARQVGILANHS
jgi:hypothetical protein